MATAYFLQLIIEMTDADIDQKHIEMLVHMRPQIPDRTNYILGRSEENPMPMLLDTGKGLVAQGAEVIAIPCITAHYFQEELDRELDCTIIHAIRETAEYLKAEQVAKVGIMATAGTIQSGLFQKVCDNYGIQCVVPGKAGQDKVMHIIYDDVKAGRPIEMNLVEEVSKELFDSGAQVILLGCTELSMIKRDCEIGKGYLDVMEVLSRASVKLCGTLKPEYEHLITR